MYRLDFLFDVTAAIFHLRCKMAWMGEGFKRHPNFCLPREGSKGSHSAPLTAVVAGSHRRGKRSGGKFPFVG